MKHYCLLVLLGPVELRLLEGAYRVRRRERLPGDRWKLRQEIRSPFRYSLRELVLVIGEVEKRRGGRELLSLKKHRRVRAEEKKRREGAVDAGRGDLVQPRACRGIGDLIVILEVADQLLRRRIERRRPAPLFLPGVALALIQESMAGHRHEFLRRAFVIRVVRLAL